LRIVEYNHPTPLQTSSYSPACYCIIHLLFSTAAEMRAANVVLGGICDIHIIMRHVVGIQEQEFRGVSYSNPGMWGSKVAAIFVYFHDFTRSLVEERYESSSMMRAKRRRGRDKFEYASIKFFAIQIFQMTCLVEQK